MIEKRIVNIDRYNAYSTNGSFIIASDSELTENKPIRSLMFVKMMRNEQNSSVTRQRIRCGCVDECKETSICFSFISFTRNAEHSIMEVMPNIAMNWQ